MKHTPNLGLYEPDVNDDVEIDKSLADNFKKIDEKLGDVPEKINEVTAQLAQKPNYDEVIRKNEGVGLDDAKPDLLGAIEGGEGTTFELLSIPRDLSVTPNKTTFFRLDTRRNLFDGNYQKYYLNGSSGNLVLQEYNGLVAIIKVKPNTHYSVAVSEDVPTHLKVATSTHLLTNHGDKFDGAINNNAGSSAKVRDYKTGENDQFMYISVVVLGYSQVPYLKVVESSEWVRVSPGETNYPFIPVGVDVYSKLEIDNMIKDIETPTQPTETTKKVKVIKTGDRMKIYIPSKRSDRYTSYTFERDIWVDRHRDIWRITNISIADNALNTLHVLSDRYDVDGVVKIVGEADYIGGYHSYEQMVGMGLLIDGKYTDLSSDLTLDCEELKTIVKSEVFHHGTTNKAFDKYKVLEFTKDGVHIYSKYISNGAIELEVARLCLLSIEKENNGVSLIDHYTENLNFLPTEKPTGLNNGSVIVIDKSINKVELFSSELYVKVWRGDSTEINNTGSIVNFDTRLKPYLDPIRNANLEAGEVFECNSYFEIYS